MSIRPEMRKARFEGCLLGLAVGDALGGLFEAQTPEGLAERFSSVERLFAYPQEELWYTDDTQMTIGVCEALLEDYEIIEETLCKMFVTNYLPPRGYGMGARAVLDAMEAGRDYRLEAENYFPGGSYGNGAAMRVAPIGLFFRKNYQRLWEQARLSALPTHLHPLGIEGAQLLALAIAIVCEMESFDRVRYFAELLKACESNEYRSKIRQASQVQTAADLTALGNQIQALHSVPTCIASFALTPESFEYAVGNIILLGGDTDTLATMTGAISGAYLGVDRVPPRLVNLLENRDKGRDYIRQLAVRLFELNKG